MIFSRTCAECGTTFDTKRKHATFCCREHADQFMNRKKVRGATLVELYMHKRYNRPAAKAAGLHTLIDKLVAGWRQEDAQSGRASMLALDDVLDRIKVGS